MKDERRRMKDEGLWRRMPSFILDLSSSINPSWCSLCALWLKKALLFDALEVQSFAVASAGGKVAVGAGEGGVEGGAVYEVFDGDGVVHRVGDVFGGGAEADAGDAEHAGDRDAVGAEGPAMHDRLFAEHFVVGVDRGSHGQRVLSFAPHGE